MRAMIDLITYEVAGPRARYERYTADMLYIMAAGERLDTDKAERFGTILEGVYRNPFGMSNGAGKLKTAADIKAYLLAKISKQIEILRTGGTIHGSDDAGGEDRS